MTNIHLSSLDTLSQEVPCYVFTVVKFTGVKFTILLDTDDMAVAGTLI